jgi:uncharacterized membrane protein
MKQKLKHRRTMETITKSIEVEVPVREAYNQWTQFEDFPQFMEGVKSVKQLDDKRLHWQAEIGGKKKEWDAEIFEQQPDERISWRALSGAHNSGTVSFHPLNATRTQVDLHLSYEPEGLIEKVGDTLGLVSSRVEGDLRRFKEFIERKGASSGWRGEIHGDKVATVKDS